MKTNRKNLVDFGNYISQKCYCERVPSELLGGFTLYGFPTPTSVTRDFSLTFSVGVTGSFTTSFAQTGQ